MRCRPACCAVARVGVSFVLRARFAALLLLLLLLIPLAAAGLVLLAPAHLARWVALAGAVAHLGTAATLWLFAYATAGLDGPASSPVLFELHQPWFGLDLGPLGRLQFRFI